MKERVVITGSGLVSPLGDSASALHQALCKGQNGLGPLHDLPLNGSGVPLGGQLKGFDPARYLGKANFRPLNRAAQLLATAAQLCLRDSLCSPEVRQQVDVGLVAGTMFCSLQTIARFDRRGLQAGPAYVSPLDFANTVINAATGQVAIWHQLRGVNSTIAEGGSSGLQAIGYAADAIASGKASMVLAGGVEELCLEALFGFFRRGLLRLVNGDGLPRPVPFDPGRNGFAPAEGAALVMLESAESARRWQASVLAEIGGHANTFDVSRGRNPNSLAEALARAMRLAIKDARLAPESVVLVSSSANGSRLGDQAEALALESVFGRRTPDVAVTAPKAQLGEALGASGAFQLADLLGSLADGAIAGVPELAQADPDLPRLGVSRSSRKLAWQQALINSIGSDGNCCSLVLCRRRS